METKEEKKEFIRKQIISASQVYKDNLSGKLFLYVIGTESFEVLFRADCFMHLAGINSSLAAKDFYDKAKDSILTTDQFCFDKRHPYRIAVRKISCLMLLPHLTDDLVCVVKDMQTRTLTYKIGITNLNFTIGLTENTDFAGNKSNDWFLPRTLRVRDNAIEKSKKADFVDFIFSKDASKEKYDTITYADKDKKVPANIAPLLDAKLIPLIER